MTKRMVVMCNTCSENLIIKMGEGGEGRQPHIFDCPFCYTELKIELKRKAYDYKVGDLENCSLTKSQERIPEEILGSSKRIICLHACFPLKKEDYHMWNGAATASIEGQQLLFSIVQKRWPTILAKNSDGTKKIIDIANYFDVTNSEDIWKNIIKPYFTVLENNVENLNLDTFKEKYTKNRLKYVKHVNVKTHKELCQDFFSSMFYPCFTNFFTILNKEIIAAKRLNESEFSKFIEFYKANHWRDAKNQFMQSGSEYFSLSTEFAQMRSYARLEKTDNENLIVGSKNFDSTKLIYGNLYERIADSCIFLGGLFNILSNRQYNEFKNISLNKFINDLSKEKRINCIKQHSPFKSFLEELNGTLRNGSHHASIYREKEILYYRPGGTGAKNKITYAEYLYSCNRLMILHTALFCIQNKWLSN